ncbi:DGQHR domain-containing protein [Rhizobium leguminosarum]|uniref:DGQHR domain-containing protein n=1 Tax=Rhizobium leguminosarum TaxID=384 RepID=UPI001C938515|nr:DGQHR domain-containing protein [Rhizobium leguminosarum]MBY5516209.1 DGQHR domain-containing protein [Rhizobium leguminosarum]
MLGELLKDFGAKRAEYARRSKAYEEESVSLALRAAREADGWSVQRTNKGSVRMRRPRHPDEILENRFWNILYRFGYSELNKGRPFRVAVGKSPNTIETRVDIFAKDEETVVIAKCMSRKLPAKISLLDDLNDFAELMKPLADTIRKHYGGEFKPKIIWCFVTENIRWSTDDARRAKEYNINIIQGLELIYFEEFSKKLGPAARYQFHAEYLEDQKVPAFAGRKVPAVKTKLGGKTAYLFSALAKDVLRIAFVNHRDLRDPSGAPSYQRIMKPARLKEIGHFLDDGKFFPNTILLNFHRKPMFEQQAKDDVSAVAFGNLILPDRYKSCWIIDGQHRLYGTTYTAAEYDTPLFFIGFDSVSTSEEANIFVEINSKQATVPPTLLSALEGEVKWDSPEPRERLSAISSRAVDLLNTRGGGPLEGKVVSPGITAGTSQPLNLRSIQDRINQSGLIGAINPRSGEILPGPSWGSTSEGSLQRLVTLLELHFEDVQSANPERWEMGKSGLLCTNFGVGSHIRLVSELISYTAGKNGMTPHEHEPHDLYNLIRPLVAPVLSFVKRASDTEFENRFKVIFGSSGFHHYFFALVDLIIESVPDFSPEGYGDFKRLSSDEVTDLADRQVKWIQKVVPAYILEKLRAQFGDDYFDRSVPKEIQKACQAKRIDDEDGEKLPVEAYLDWIQLQRIVIQKDVRDSVKEVLSIQLQDEGGGKHFYSAWFESVNRIRRIVAHPSGRSYKDDDLRVISLVVEHLVNSLPSAYTVGEFVPPMS